MTLPNPSRRPSVPRSAVITTFAQKSVPSLRTRQPSSSSARRRRRSRAPVRACRREVILRVEVATGRPTISSAVYPLTACAPRFQVATLPSASKASVSRTSTLSMNSGSKSIAARYPVTTAAADPRQCP